MKDRNRMEITKHGQEVRCKYGKRSVFTTSDRFVIGQESVESLDNHQIQ